MSSAAGAGSVGPATAAPPLLAYVWPAIALGPAGKLVMGVIQARLGAVSLLLASAAPRLLSDLAGVAGVDRVSGPPERLAIPSAAPNESRQIQVPSGGEISLPVLIVLCAVLMGLLVFTVGREFRSLRRWPY